MLKLLEDAKTFGYTCAVLYKISPPRKTKTETVKEMFEFVQAAQNCPMRYKSKSQQKRLQKYKYILGESKDLNLQTDSQKKQIMLQRSRLEAMKQNEKGSLNAPNNLDQIT